MAPLFPVAKTMTVKSRSVISTTTLYQQFSITSSLPALRQGFDRFQVTHPVCKRCMGADTPQKSLLRQVGSVVYFKLYNPVMKRITPGWGEI